MALFNEDAINPPRTGDFIRITQVYGWKKRDTNSEINIWVQSQHKKSRQFYARPTCMAFPVVVSDKSTGNGKIGNTYVVSCKKKIIHSISGFVQMKGPLPLVAEIT